MCLLIEIWTMRLNAKQLFQFHGSLATTGRLLIVNVLLWSTLLYFPCAESHEVNDIGNDVVASTGGLDLSVGSAVFLLNEQFPQSGVLFAFSAYFRNRNPLQFQVWRPALGTARNGSDFTLLTELEITPSVNGSQELVYIVSQLTEKCVRIKTGDRLGVYFVNTTPSLVYTFDAFHPNPRILVHYQDGPNSLQLTPNDTLKFDTRVFPYYFSLKAYYYLENSSSVETSTTLDCPKNQLIEGDPKPTSPTTPIPVGIPGPVGSMGATGPVGVIGAGGPSSAGDTGWTGSFGQVGQQGSTGLIGAIGLPGLTGLPGDFGYSGSNGSIGATGYTGSTGPIGDNGLSGVIIYINETDRNRTGEPESQDQLQIDSHWISKSYMQGSLIWLAIMSFLLIIVFIILGILTSLYRSRQRVLEDVAAKMSTYGMSDYNTMSSRQSRPGFTNHNTIKSQRDIEEDLKDMREESFANYEVNTIEKYATRKLKDFSTED